MASIRGVPLGTPFGSNVSQPDIGQNFSRWQGWWSDPETLPVRFEDLVGESGGGEKRLATIERRRGQPQDLCLGGTHPSELRLDPLRCATRIAHVSTL